jgi:hypothetical protein
MISPGDRFCGLALKTEQAMRRTRQARPKEYFTGLDPTWLKLVRTLHGPGVFVL